MIDLATFLAAVEKLPSTMRHQRLAHLEMYFLGKQYEGRRLDVNGYQKDLPGAYGSTTMTPSWKERDPGSTWNMTGEAVGELTAWTLGADSWCAFTVVGDATGTDWLNAAIEVGGLQDIAVRARNWGGGLGTACVSFAVRQGKLSFETHNPRLCWVLAWADPVEHVPAVVAKVYRGDNPLAMNEDELPLMLRIWTENDETIYRLEKNKQTGRWQMVDPITAVHNLGRCLFVWHPQRSVDGAHDGTPDGEGTEGKIDEVNELLGAASATTKRNADDTLVIKEDPALNTGEVRKGGFNMIVARGGADYLSQDGASAKVCLEVADRHADHIWRRFGVTMAGPQDLGGNTTAELLKRLFQRTINTAGALRQDYGKGLLGPLAELLLFVGRELEKRGTPILVPPREQPDPKLPNTVFVVPRSPGTKGTQVTVQWPPPFPQTIDDLDKLVRAASKATGDQAVLSLKTVLAWMKTSALPLRSVDEELAELQADAERKAKLQAEGMGLGAPPKGEAGPVGKAPASGDQEEPDPANETSPLAAE